MNILFVRVLKLSKYFFETFETFHLSKRHIESQFKWKFVIHKIRKRRGGKYVKRGKKAGKKMEEDTKMMLYKLTSTETNFD